MALNISMNEIFDNINANNRILKELDRLEKDEEQRLEKEYEYLKSLDDALPENDDYSDVSSMSSDDDNYHYYYIHLIDLPSLYHLLMHLSSETRAKTFPNLLYPNHNNPMSSLSPLTFAL